MTMPEGVSQPSPQPPRNPTDQWVPHMDPRDNAYDPSRLHYDTLAGPALGPFHQASIMQPHEVTPAFAQRLFDQSALPYLTHQELQERMNTLNRLSRGADPATTQMLGAAKIGYARFLQPYELAGRGPRPPLIVEAAAGQVAMHGLIEDLDRADLGVDYGRYDVGAARRATVRETPEAFNDDIFGRLFNAIGNRALKGVRISDAKDALGTARDRVKEVRQETRGLLDESAYQRDPAAANFVLHHPQRVRPSERRRAARTNDRMHRGIVNTSDLGSPAPRHSLWRRIGFRLKR